MFLWTDVFVSLMPLLRLMLLLLLLLYCCCLKYCTGPYDWTVRRTRHKCADDFVMCSLWTGGPVNEYLYIMSIPLWGFRRLGGGDILFGDFVSICVFVRPVWGANQYAPPPPLALESLCYTLHKYIIHVFEIELIHKRLAVARERVRAPLSDACMSCGNVYIKVLRAKLGSALGLTSNIKPKTQRIWNNNAMKPKRN